MCTPAAAIALIVAIYFTFRALIVREPQKESDLECEGDPKSVENSAGSAATKK